MMMFMVPQFTTDDFAEYDHNGDAFACPLDVIGTVDGLDEYHVYVGKHWYRLSAPGYLDCTEWSGPFDSHIEAVSDCMGNYGDDPEMIDALADELDGFDEFWNGYLEGLGFTATVDNEDGESAFGGSGEWTDNHSADDVAAVLNADDVAVLKADCLSFFVDAVDLIGDEFNRAGADFHLTRNGHGAGFWDRGDLYGSAENGRKLTDLSKPYGSAELMQCVADNGDVCWSIVH